VSFLLPDIDLNSWTDYQRRELQRQLDEKMQGFTLQSALEEKVAGLQEVVGQINPFDQPEPQAAPAVVAPLEPAAVEPPPVEPPPVEPPPVVTPPSPPEVQSPVAVATPPPPVVEAQRAGPSPLSSALQAVQARGGDVGAFIEAFNSGVGDQGARARAALQQVITPPERPPAVRPDLVPTRDLEPPSRAARAGVTGPAAAAPPPAQAGGVNPNPSPDEVRAYITRAAQVRGIDPQTALTVANSEGGMEAARRGTFKTGSSWYPFQLHYGGKGYEHLGNVAGMGNSFTAETGFAPGDPRGWEASVDYALDRAKKSGWGAWYGAAAKGITGFSGIDKSVPDQPGLFEQAVDRAKKGAGDVVAGAQQAATGALGQISQFGDAALSAGEAAAACGPAAAVRFAQRFGRNPTLREAVDLAKTVGWTAAQGMAGIASEHKLMEKLGIPVDLVMGRDWNRVTQEAQTGNPVTISTSKHYFTIDDYDAKTGKYHVGSSGTDLRGGSDWMSAAQMEAALGGGVMQGALIADNPSVAAQSIAGMDTNPLDWIGRQKDSAVQEIQQLGGEVVDKVREPVSTLGTRAQDLGDIVVRQLDQAIDRVAEVTEPLTTGLGEQQRIADELRGQAEQERLGLQDRPYNPVEQVGESVIQSSEQISRAPGQLYGADVAAGQALSGRVVDAAKAAGWDPDPGQERFVRNTVAQVTPANVLLSALTAGQGSLLRTIAQGTAELAGGAIGSELALEKAQEAGWPEWAQTGAQLAGGLGGGISGALGTQGAFRAADSPAVQAAVRSRLPAEAEVGFAMGAPTGGLARTTPSPGTALAPDASDALRAADEDAARIRTMREKVIRQEVPIDPTPDEVKQVLNGLSAAAERTTDRRARLKSLEDHLERLQGEPLSPEQKAWMASRNYEGHQDAALATLERLTTADLSAVPKHRRVDLEVFLEQMDNADKALATERKVAAEVGARPLRPVAGTAAADRAEIALRNAERDLAGLEKLEAEGRGPGTAAVQAAEAKVARLQTNLEDLTGRTAERQTGRIETEALEEMGREPVRLSLRDAELRFRDAQRAYDIALDKEDLAARGMGPLPDPVRLRAAERELDRAEWQLMKAEESAGAASEARQTRIGERAEADIARIEERGPVETPAMARAARDVQYAERDLARAQRNVEARGAAAQQDVVARAQTRLDRAMEHLQAETAAAEAARAERAAAAGQAAFGARKFSGGGTGQAPDAVREATRQRVGDDDFALLEKAAESVWASSRHWRDRLARAGVIGETQRQFLEDHFPHYVHTDILDDMSQEAIDSLPQGGKSFSVGSNGIQRLSVQGTERARMNPTSSMVDMATRAEGLAQRNEIMRTVAGWSKTPGMDLFIKPLKAGEKPPKGYVTMSYMDGENGKQSIAVVEGLEGTLDLSKPNAGILGMFLSGASLPLRAGATALRPGFIAFNGTNDLLWSLYRFAVDAPLPVEGAKARRDLAKGLAVVFGPDASLTERRTALKNVAVGERADWGERAASLGDLMTGYRAQLPRRLGGDPELVQRAREAGATVGGPRTRYENPDAIARELMGDRVWVRPIRTQKDVTTALKDSWGAATDVAGLFWSRPLNVVGKPIEEAPRLGAFARAERLGLSPAEAAFAKRTQTADFDAGGAWTKQMNNLMPFLNATTQAAAEFGALTKKNPRASAVAQGVIIGTIVASEIYNRAISQEDHRDVSRHLRDHGLALLDPREPEGEGKRGLAFVPLRGGVGMLVPLIREVMGRMYGDNPRTWERLALEVFGTLSPVEPEMGGLASLVPPPAKTALELSGNYDYFRDQPIVSESMQGLPPTWQYNERTSQAARHLSASGLPGVSQKPPLAIDYAIRAISPGPGEAALGLADEIITRTGNALPERPAKGVPGARDIPLVGGIAGRFLRTAGEEQRSEAYARADEIMDINRQKMLADVENSAVFKAATPDAQQSMLRSFEAELEAQAQDIAGVEPKDRDLGLPEKYVGVEDPKLQRQIDQARSKYDAWKQDPARAPEPSDDEIVLALTYGKTINPLYRIESQEFEDQKAEIRYEVQRALAAERDKRVKR